MTNKNRNASSRTVWGKVVLFLKEHKFIALHVACGDITDVDIMDNYFKMIRGEDYDSSKLGDSIVYDNIKNQPNRIKCATLSWNGVYKEIMKYREELEDK